ncbi:AAA family ATPase [Actinoplanes sp. NPDC089786]|uniref:nSTAND1 domain-containing NTPase n=1 Tax=Actinoplanes sp. NPDC089786 TaxID=3155185 RepID=UPI00341DB53D
MSMKQRETFADRFALLYAEAGNPPLKRVTASVAGAGRTDERGQGVRVSAQRVSDWRSGRNVPARFTVLATVLHFLIGQARERRARPVVTGLYDLDAWRTLWTEALASPAGDTSPGEPSGDDDAGLCPYQGLAAYGTDDAGRFFGRERATRDLVARLGDALTTGGIVALVGASGSGKSSLLRAGLVPALARGTLPADGSANWPAVLLVPGTDPVKALAGQIPDLSRALDETIDTPGEKFAAGVRAACAAYAERLAGPGARLVLVADQFEEAFTLCRDDARRSTFIRALHAACTPPGPGVSAPAVVVLGLRADFYARCLEYAELAGALQDRQMVLGPMTSAELRDAITCPAKAVGVRPEAGLVEVLLRDLGGGDAYEPGALPLLSHTLLALWQRRQAGRLTVAGYRATGGIQGAVAATGERAWEQLGPDAQAAARRLLLRLVRVGEDTRDTRRRTSSADLAKPADGAVAEALEVLARERLITLDDGCVEISHEALLRAWPRLRRWIDQDRAGSLARQRLEEDAAAWRRTGRDPSQLYRGARLEAARYQVTPATQDELTIAARDFLAASTRQRRRATWARRCAATALAVATIAAVAAAVLAVRQRDEAVFRQVLSEADRLQATDQSLSAQLNLVAHRLRRDDRDVYARLISSTNTPLATPLPGHSGAVYLTSFSPDGRVLATASYDNTVRLWDLRDPTRPAPLGKPLTGHTSWVTSAVFSPDGRVLATAGNDRTIRLWNVDDPANPSPVGAPFGGAGGTVYSVAFSPDGQTLATANENHTVGWWDLRDPARPVPRATPLAGHTAAVRSVAFSPGGRLLATAGDDRTVRLWNVTDLRRPTAVGRPLTGHGELIHTTAFSPDGRILATGSKDKTIRLWDVTAPARPVPLGAPLIGHTGPVWSVAFSPDGRVLASGSVDSTTQLWNLADPSAVTQLGPPLTANTGIVFAVAFSPDGRTVATGSADGVTRIWSLPPGILAGHRASVVRVATDPTGDTLASASDDQTVRLWGIADPGRPVTLGRPLTEHRGMVFAAAFSPDGHTLATTSNDGTVRLWNVTDRADPVPFRQPITTRNRYTAPVAFSPDGHTLATTGDDQTVQLWNIDNPDRPTALGTLLPRHAGYVNSVAFSPDGRLLVTASSDKTVRLWDVRDPADPVPFANTLSSHHGPVTQAVFAPGTRRLATASDDRTVRLWDLSDPNRPTALGRPLTGHTEPINAIAFSPDGRLLVTASSDKTVRLWNVRDPADPRAAGEIATGHRAGILSLVFAGGGYTLATASTDNTVRLWNLDAEAAITRICARTRNVVTPEVWHRYIPQLPYDPPCR